MKHSEVVSLFNELGHAVRNLLTRVKFASSHSGYDTDFIVTPSKMLEHFLWDPRQIHWLSRHYSYLADQPSEKQRGKPEKMPDTLVKSLVSSRFSLGAIDTLQQAARSRFALTVHNQAMRADVEALDLTALYNSLRDDYSMLCGPDHHWAHAETTFNPVFSHWAAAHYSFLHSSAVGADLFESAFKHDPMSPHTGRRFRRVVLEPGGHKPQHLLLNEFLGRPPSNEAFIKGLTG
jgi:metallopeptidase MepB